MIEYYAEVTAWLLIHSTLTTFAIIALQVGAMVACAWSLSPLYQPSGEWGHRLKVNKRRSSPGSPPRSSSQEVATGQTDVKAVLPAS